MDKELLKEILSIPSYSGNELKLVNFICELSIIHFIKNAGWLILSNVIVVRVE